MHDNAYHPLSKFSLNITDHYIDPSIEPLEVIDIVLVGKGWQPLPLTISTVLPKEKDSCICRCLDIILFHAIDVLNKEESHVLPIVQELLMLRQFCHNIVRNSIAIKVVLICFFFWQVEKN